ncbi:hypothetical protein BGZ60DRAFT_435972 [Tricladium varicosporioides]|nr:hypothetical protein BGZ60DRAFT_435972 [Hymenoscyphus varicosporioides]
MVVLTKHLLGLLALGSITAAAPQLVPGTETVVPAVPTTETVAPPPPQATSTTTPTSGKIDIPLDVIKAAPVDNKPATDPSLASIPGKGDNSTLVNARPELQTYVNSANVSTSNTTIPKRDFELGERSANPKDCKGGFGPELTIATWLRIIDKICEIWYPDPLSFRYDPSGPVSIPLQHSHFVTPLPGAPGLLNLDLKYGVADWGTQSIYKWQKFYVPQTQALCKADLTNLVSDMKTCFFWQGYDTSKDITGTGMPKWYSFSVS